MAKKKSCRRTEEENFIHDTAVKLRKMTDEQLIQYVENTVEKAKKEGFNCGKKCKSAMSKVNISDIIEEVGQIKGIGITKLTCIKDILEKHLEVNADA